MKCSNCGSDLMDNAKFCARCGNAVKPAAPVAPPAATPVAPPVKAPVAPPVAPPAAPTTPTYTAPPTPPAPPAPPVYAPTEAVKSAPIAPRKKKKSSKKGKLPIYALGGAAAVVVLAILLVVILSIPSGGKVPAALAKSVGAYTGIWEDMGLTGIFDAVTKDQAYSSSITLTYEDMSDLLVDELGVALSSAEGLGIQVSQSVNLKDRLYSGTASAIYEGSSIISVNYGVDDKIAWINAPKLVADTYGADTTTLGEDLVKLGADEEVESLGFNVYDLAEMAMNMKPGKDVTKAFTDAGKDLLKEMEYEKKNSKEIRVNGNSVKCDVYKVTISQDALENYLDAIEQPLKDYLDQYVDSYEEMLRSIGMPDDEVRNAMDSFDDLNTRVIIKSLEDVLDEIGDLQFDVYIKGGYVMKLVYDLEIQGEGLTITLEMGGGKNYEDDFTATLETYDGSVFMELESTGNHTGKGGKYSDTTELTLTIDGETATVSLESNYAPKEKGNNFDFDLSVKSNSYYSPVSIGLTGEGRLVLEKKNLDMQLEELSVNSGGMNILTLGLDFSIGTYEKAQAAKNVVLLADLDQDDFMDISEEIMTNGEDLAMEILEEFPGMMEMIYS